MIRYALGRGMLVLLGVWLAAPSARAETFVVTSEEDELDAAPGDGACATRAGRCSLRAAVNEANALAGLDRIYVSGRHTLTRGPLRVLGALEIAGREARYAVIDAGGASRVLEIASRRGEGGVRLAAVSLENGYAGPSSPNGGAVLIADPASSLVLERCEIKNSRAVGSGGGIYNLGSLELQRSSLRSNASGLEPGSAAGAAGGGIYNLGSMVIERSALDRNEARKGAGLANAAGGAELSNVTFSRNWARERGGGVWNALGASAWLTFCTVADNQAGDDTLTPASSGHGGGVFNAGSLQLTATVVARNHDLRTPDVTGYAPDCVSEAPARLTSGGALVLGVVTDRCAHTRSASDQRGSALAPLDAGLEESTQFREFEVAGGYQPLSESVAIDAVRDASICTGRDQWGRRRPGVDWEGRVTRCDAGAIEVTADVDRRSVMLVTGNRSLSPTDLVLAVKLFDLGFDVFDESPSDLSEEVLQRDMTLISDTAPASALPSWIYGVEKPILTLNPGTLSSFGMTNAGSDTWGRRAKSSGLSVNAGSPIAAGPGRWAVVAERAATFGWGVPATRDAFVVARFLPSRSPAIARRALIFGYKAGARLAGGATAPAPRVAFFAVTDTPQLLNSNGWGLFEAAVDYLAPAP